MKNKLAFAVSSLVFFGSAEVAARQAGIEAVPATSHERLQVLIEGHMASEAALAAEERAAVAAVRANPWNDELRQRALVRDIRRAYRGRSKAMAARHASEKKALTVEPAAPPRGA